MESIAAILVWIYLGGIVVSVLVLRVRAGVGVWHGLRIFGPNGFGPVWAVTLVACSMVWPVALAVWLVRGRPEPRVVFNEKALERRRRQAGAV